MKENFDTFKLSLEHTGYEVVNNKVTICKCIFRVPANLIQFTYGTQFSKQALGIVEGVVSTRTDSYFTLYSEGYTYCHSTDTFNEKIGKSIAFARAFISAHKKFRAILDMAKAALDLKQYKVCNNLWRECCIIKNEVKYLNSLINKQLEEI